MENIQEYKLLDYAINLLITCINNIAVIYMMRNKLDSALQNIFRSMFGRL